ncbi:hypothetical protein [Roseibium sp.]|uniref:hypothetical protein n=1 Tax=Roseibium sp. TaxID=1936156 RepID=UPI003D0BD439
MLRTIVFVGILSSALSLASCAVGPGTPLIDALKTEPGQGSGNVPAPRGYSPTAYGGEPTGLINPKEREATEAYLKSLASE